MNGNMDFVAIDVETANADMSSVCQIGIARHENGNLVKEWKSYVDPEDYFDGINVSIHGIDESVVRGSPRFPDLVATLGSFLGNSIVVCHTHFDRVAMNQVAEKYEVSLPPITWLDSARVARRAWKDFARSGYGLHTICSYLGYEFRHHDALEDAKAAAHILIAAATETGLSIEDWLKRVEQPIDPKSVKYGEAIRRNGDPEGPLFGEVLVFTGALDMPRREAADLAASIGCNVSPGVTKKTTLLVIGDQDHRKLAGHTKSSKYRKAEELIRKGVRIRILTEKDFKELVRLSDEKGET